ncbi:MAG: protoheme IX farnesyltransferase [Bacteroidetes bacterium OLB9]|nr:MAG: protoheme IX farnesyltransferase [Bacteroidetes bacterium OLB9]MCZ2337243.1 heme o synthase [Chitinophagales bacterium]
MKEGKVHTGVLSVNEVAAKIQDYLLLIKVRLSSVVVISSLLGYIIVSGGTGHWLDVWKLFFGGFLVTGAANALNQVFEKDYDILMTRTANRPVAAGRMKPTEGIIFAGLSCLVGILILASFNPITGLLGMLSLILYSFVYTPMKRISTVAVPIGAIPGALPVMIGVTAYEGRITMLALVLFVIQFLWQFPHFWAIGFLGYEDYAKAGYKLVPITNGKLDRNLGLSSMFYSGLIIPVALFMYIRMDMSLLSTCIVLLLTFIYTYYGYRVQKEFTKAAALKLMFFSFLYLPLVLMAYWLV